LHEILRIKYFKVQKMMINHNVVYRKLHHDKHYLLTTIPFMDELSIEGGGWEHLSSVSRWRLRRIWQGAMVSDSAAHRRREGWHLGGEDGVPMEAV
jgi:hypothetical protein